MGLFKKIGKPFKKAFSNPVRALTAVGTFGTSEVARKIGGPVGQLAKLPETASDAVLGTHFNRSGADLPSFNGAQDPATLLSQTGGAPLLANIAMGVNPEDALAGYFGKSTKDGSWQEFLNGVNQKDFDAINSVHGQLTTIQSTRDIRQKAVDDLIKDFPNVMATESQRAGVEFDSQMKSYVDNALQGTAAKFAANGGISSGAANEAFAKVGAENGLKRLDYTTNMGKDVFNTRLAEVNALRDFQNTMLTGQVSQGFSAQQANLQRQFQGDAANSEMQNQRFLADQQSKNALFGAVGSLGGSLIGAKLLGANIFGSPSSSNIFNPPKVNTSSYKRISGEANV